MYPDDGHQVGSHFLRSYTGQCSGQGTAPHIGRTPASSAASRDQRGFCGIRQDKVRRPGIAYSTVGRRFLLCKSLREMFDQELDLKAGRGHCRSPL